MPKPTRVAINGFGRIGRMAFKAAQSHPSLEIVAINDLTDAATLAHLLKYDSSYGIYEKDVESAEDHLIIDGKRIPIFSEKEPGKLPWREYEVDVVLESTGHFKDKEGATHHLDAGARRVVISAPPKGEGIPTYLIGVNEDTYDGAPIVSNASCTTNSVGVTAAVLHEKFGIVKAIMSTVHSYTATQNLQDGPHKDLRRARAAAENIVPTTTGAARSTTEIVTDLKDRFDGRAYRVPVPVGSISEITAVLKQSATVEELNNAFIQSAKSPRLEKVLSVTDQPLVSSDIVGDSHSAIVDLSLTQVVDGDLARVFAWYDNEWGYSNRLVELAEVVAKTL